MDADWIMAAALVFTSAFLGAMAGDLIWHWVIG
jgi:hypothetical protein